MTAVFPGVTPEALAVRHALSALAAHLAAVFPGILPEALAVTCAASAEAQAAVVFPGILPEALAAAMPSALGVCSSSSRAASRSW